MSWGVWQISTLGLFNDTEALKMLKTATEAVGEIMEKRKWRVVHLKEFVPRGYKLLGVNVNRGSEVRIRLRTSKEAKTFLRFEAVLDTLLHELVHNSIGRHDKSFYKLLDEIKLECEMKLMGAFHVRPALPEPKAMAVKKPKGKGHILGGNLTNYRSMSQRELAA